MFRFNYAHRKLYNRLKQLGAEEFFERGEADEQHPDGMDGTWVPWMTSLHRALREQYPLAASEKPIPDDVYLPPEWALDFVPDQAAIHDRISHNATNGTSAQAAHSGTDSNNNNTINQNTTPAVALADHDQTVISGPQQSSLGPSAANDSIAPSGHFTATLLNIQRVTPDDHWQDVRLFEFTTPPITYEPGDVLTIFPHNTTAAVDKLITLMHWEEHADKSIHFVPGSPNEIPASPEPNVPQSTSYSGLTLRKLISQHLDLNAIPRRSFFSSLSHFTTDEFQHERLTEFAKAEYIDEFFDYATRPRRSIIEVLDEFDTVKLPWRWIADILPAIRGRQFSIASGGELKRNADGSGRIELLIAMVKYRTIIKKTREGLCSRYLSGLEVGSKLDVLLCKGGMRVDMNKPGLLIGPGTGVAPLRSMLFERAQLEAKQGTLEKQKQLLFFGGRNRSADYFFEQDWQKLEKQIDLDVYTAFSREQVCFLSDFAVARADHIPNLTALENVRPDSHSQTRPLRLRHTTAWKRLHLRVCLAYYTAEPHTDQTLIQLFWQNAHCSSGSISRRPPGRGEHEAGQR
jgi:sulfite reductase alpha subunit-like flavoprotein